MTNGSHLPLNADNVTPLPNSQWLLGNREFARAGFLEINKEQMRLRLLAMSTGGLVASLSFSLFFLQNRDIPSLVTTQSTIIGSLSLSLSIFYALLGLIYVNLSGQRANVVAYLDRVPDSLRLDLAPTTLICLLT